MKIICLFLPAIIAALLDFKINKIKFEENKISFISIYFLYVFLINLIMNTILWFFGDNKYIIYNESAFTYDFCLKFMWVSLIIALLLPFVKNIVEKRACIELKISKK